ncbi:hypothetical protein GCM10011419_29940 [Vogesella fluminis]|uniref:Tyr recombinase domain-containing protein n=2 Tax=Vogesella fluminis TaxID=1069161 RepID=A0ABQ3HCQ6_9NEIS|nr:hypothetical protein GCM10011419_29940 [Vogesella fluminis]
MSHLFKSDRPMDRYLTGDEEKRLLKLLACRADTAARRDHAWIRTLLYSGLRIGEFSQLTVGDVRAALATRYLFVAAELRKHSDGVAHDHQVFVHAALRQALLDLLALAKDGGSEADGDPLIAGRFGSAMSVRNYQLRFAQWAALAGLPSEASVHWLRHTCAMRLLRASQAKDPLAVVQRQLGHRSVESTRVYAHATREELETALADAFPVRQRVTRRQLRQAWQSRQEVA